MAQSKIDFVSLSDEQLVEEVQRLEKEYQNAQFEHAVSGLANPLDLRKMRREIARGLTEGRRREITQMTEEQLAQRTKIRARRRRGK